MESDNGEGGRRVALWTNGPSTVEGTVSDLKAGQLVVSCNHAPKKTRRVALEIGQGQDDAEPPSVQGKQRIADETSQGNNWTTR